VRLGQREHRNARFTSPADRLKRSQHVQHRHRRNRQHRDLAQRVVAAKVHEDHVDGVPPAAATAFALVGPRVAVPEKPPAQPLAWRWPRRRGGVRLAYRNIGLVRRLNLGCTLVQHLRHAFRPRSIGHRSRMQHRPPDHQPGEGGERRARYVEPLTLRLGALGDQTQHQQEEQHADDLEHELRQRQVGRPIQQVQHGQAEPHCPQHQHANHTPTHLRHQRCRQHDHRRDAKRHDDHRGCCAKEAQHLGHHPRPPVAHEHQQQQADKGQHGHEQVPPQGARLAQPRRAIPDSFQRSVHNREQARVGIVHRSM
jgi:hypothetical protein